MTCTIARLNILCYANGFTLWHYAATHDQQPEQHSFFENTKGMVETGDIIIISPERKSAMPFIRLALLSNDKLVTLPLAGVPPMAQKAHNQFLTLSGASSDKV